MHFDFQHAVHAPFRMQPGLRRLPPGCPQLTPNAPGSRHLREKLAVLFGWPEDALLCQPGFEAAPALAALATQAAAEHPGAWDISPDQRWQARWLGWSVDAFGSVQDDGSTLPEVGNCLRSLPSDWRAAAIT